MRKSILILGIISLLLPLGALWAKPKWSPEYEKKLGGEAAAEVEKKWKLGTDEAKLKLLGEMITAIAAVSRRPEVVYTVKIVEEKEVNAFSLPGGFVYVTTGLLEDVQSDDELAGVLAHEITHNAFYDALERAEKSKKMFMGSIAMALGALIVGAKGDQISAALAAGEYIRLGVLSKYSMTVESRADSEALKYLEATKKYNPVGMLTFMERLAATERHKPKQELGVYGDHPDTDKRCQAISAQLEAAGVEINRRAVTKWDPAKVEEKEIEGKKYAVLSLWEVEILKADPAGIDRVKAMGEVLTKALADGLVAYEINADVQSTPPKVKVGSLVMVTVSAEDAAFAGVSQEELAKQIVSNLGAAMHKENLGRWW